MKIYHFSPNRCVFCKRFACYDELAVCSECIHKLQEMFTKKCKKCGKTPTVCGCAKNGDIRYMIFYGDKESKRVIYYLKRHPDFRTVEFFADLMIRACGIKTKTFDGVTYVPRSRKNKRYYGFDQSKELARAVSELYGIPLLHLLKRKGRGEQKLLSRTQRMRSAVNKYQPKNIPEEKYKKILIIDDVCTTGSTIKACADIIRRNSAKAVVPIVIAKTMQTV